jgi:hypothetical protein
MQLTFNQRIVGSTPTGGTREVFTVVGRARSRTSTAQGWRGSLFYGSTGRTHHELDADVIWWDGRTFQHEAFE